ncbi:DUF6520 family protein [uncultured Polaribacter sp.]|uniref:DUF6520 family protein n=1 Tax=uncultured Polaribacter sp. TaxID=174711 RepID=UPI00263540B4|nr:DUF6520 family protein [uncultured Polaribacter sp.]
MRKKVFIPFFAIAFAIVTAFAGIHNTRDAFTAIDGYIDAENCENPIQCSTIVSLDECTYLGVQVYGKDSPFDTSCQRVVYKQQ